MKCWVEKSAVRQGPLSEDQVAQRVRLGLLGSLDRISIDGAPWVYLRETAFWKPTRTLVSAQTGRRGVAVPPSRPANLPVSESKAASLTREILEKFIKPAWMEV